MPRKRKKTGLTPRQAALVKAAMPKAKAQRTPEQIAAMHAYRANRKAKASAAVKRTIQPVKTADPRGVLFENEGRKVAKARVYKQAKATAMTKSPRVRKVLKDTTLKSHSGPLGGRLAPRAHQTIDEAGSPRVYKGNSQLYNPKAPQLRAVKRTRRRSGLDMR